MFTSSTLKLPFGLPTENILFHIQHNAYPILHCHDDFWDFMFVSEGVMLHKINGETRNLKKNTLCIVRPSDVHAILQPKETFSIHFNLAIRTQYLKELFNTLHFDLYDKLCSERILEYEVSTANAEAIARSANIIITADHSHKAPMMALYLFTILQEVVTHIVATKDIQPQYSNCTNRLIRLLNNPENLSLGLNQLADMIGYSYSHLNRTFLQETNMTPSQYLKKQRLKYAQDLIQYTDTPISDISFKVGYSNYSHFSDFFKAMTGLTPVKWGEKNQSHLLQNNFMPLSSK